MKVGHICLAHASDDEAQHFLAIVEGLDRLAIEQHVLVSDPGMARRLRGLSYVTLGPAVRTPVMAYCLMPAVDVLHVHDDCSGQAGLLMTLTRSVPFVMTAKEERKSKRNALKRSVLHRAQATFSPGSLDAESLVAVYRRAAAAWSKFPENSNCG